MIKTVPRSRIELFNSMSPDDLIRVYTYQSQYAIDDIEKMGYLSGYGDITAGDTPEWKPAYDWMREQMKTRIERYSGDWPVWAILKRKNNRLKSERKRKGLSEQYRVSALVPKRRVLLSDYHAWHFCLNQNSYDSTEAEYEDSCARYPNHWEADDETIKRYFAAIQPSWDKIFDFSKRSVAEKYWLGTDTHYMVQLCVDRIYANEITSIRKFNIVD